MDLYELRLDQPHPGTRDGDPGHGRVCQLPHPPRARAGRAPGAVAGTASRDESSMSDRARAQVTTPEALPDERLTDAALRPSRLDEFVGQAKVKESLQIAIDAAKQRREPLDHTLFFGPPGLGKTTLALLMAKELGVNIRTTSGPVLERPGDLVGMLTSLGAGDILFIDEVHRLRPVLEEFLYPAMEDYRVDVRIADGLHAQTIPMALERFTLIGATTRFGLLTPPMRARFGLLERLAVDEFGLDDMDGRILKTIIEQFEGGPVGLTTIAAAVGEDPGTLEEVYEPFLMQRGFLARTPRGRCATGAAYKHFGFTPPQSAEQPTMFDG